MIYGRRFPRQIALGHPTEPGEAGRNSCSGVRPAACDRWPASSVFARQGAHLPDRRIFEDPGPEDHPADTASPNAASLCRWVTGDLSGCNSHQHGRLDQGWLLVSLASGNLRRRVIGFGDHSIACERHPRDPLAGCTTDCCRHGGNCRKHGRLSHGWLPVNLASRSLRHRIIGLADHATRPHITRGHSPMVRTTLDTGRLLLTDSLSCCEIISSYFGSVVSVVRAVTCTTL
jgi:hypothetical protein